MSPAAVQIVQDSCHRPFRRALTADTMPSDLARRVLRPRPGVVTVWTWGKA